MLWIEEASNSTIKFSSKFDKTDFVVRRINSQKKLQLYKSIVQPVLTLQMEAWLSRLKLLALIPNSTRLFILFSFLQLVRGLHVVNVITYSNPRPRAYRAHALTNHWAIWPNDEMRLIVYRIKWPRSSSHC